MAFELVVSHLINYQRAEKETNDAKADKHEVVYEVQQVELLLEKLKGILARY